jgi:hypothetical protein
MAMALGHTLGRFPESAHQFCPARGILNIPGIHRNPRDFKGEALGQLFVVETSKALVRSIHN